MKRILLFLWLMATTSFAQYLPVGPAAQRPALNGTYNINIDAASGFPIKTPKTGNASVLFNVDSRSIAQVRAINALTLNATPPQVINITDSRKEGAFVLDLNDNTSSDNGGTILKTASGLVYKRFLTDVVNVEWFGAVGDGLQSSDVINRNAIQAACDFVAANTNPGTYGAGSPNAKRPNTVYIPAGTYFVSGTINLKGAFRIMGDGWLSYGGTLLYTSSAGSGTDLFNLVADSDGGSNAMEIEKLRLRLFGSVARTSAIYSGSPAGGSFHSLRVRQVGFQNDGQNQACYTGLKNDDVKFESCVFDGTVGPGTITLGESTTATNLVSNCSIVNCTFYANSGGLIRAINVDGLLFANNRVYTNVSAKIPYVIDALNNGPVSGKRIQIIGNSFDGVNKILATKFDGALVTGNVATHSNSRLIEIGGGSLVKDIRVTNNILSGIWSGTLSNGSGGSVPDAPVFAFNTPVANCIFDNNIRDTTNASVTAYYLPSTVSPWNLISGKVSGFSNPFLVANYNANVNDFNRYVQGDFSLSRAGYLTSILGDIPSGFYTYNGSANVPTDPTGFNFWYLYVSRYENGTGNGTFWNNIILTNFKNKTTYVGGIDQQTGTLVPWQTMSADLTTTTATLSGASATTTYTLVAHGLGATPSYFDAKPTSSNASQQHWITADATNVYVNFATNPTTGTNNLKFNVTYKK